MAKVRNRRPFAFAAVGVPVIAAAFFGAKTKMLNPYMDNANYRVQWEQPTGWKEEQHGPQTLFLYRANSGVLLRGAVNQIVAEYNPTPELHTDALADYYIDRTHENMPDWSAKKLGWVDAGNTRFRLIWRERKDKTVVTAYAVKGNTTLMVSLSGNGKEKGAVERQLRDFERYISTISLQQENMGEL